MARQKVEKEQRSFIKGLITEAGPLTFPEDASLVDKNFMLMSDGSRTRRLGMNYEAGYVIHTSSQTMPSDGRIASSTFLWENANGNPALQIIVVQLGSELTFFRRAEAPVSDDKLESAIIPGLSSDVVCSYANIDGKLVVACGLPSIFVFEINEDLDVSFSTKRLKMRDLFGVEDIDTDGTDMLEGFGISKRPSDLLDPHIYNLRNQTWGPPRPVKDGEGFVDPIGAFSQSSQSSGDAIKYQGSLYYTGSQWRVSGLGETKPFDKNSRYYVSGPGVIQADAHLISQSGMLEYKRDSTEQFSVSAGQYLVWNDSAGWLLAAASEVASAGFPSNADNLVRFLYPDTSDSDDREVDRFHPRDAGRTIPGTSRAPTGYFIIDALERGVSRLEEASKLMARYGQLQFPITELPLDTTPGGAMCLESYAGRVFYAGFSGEIQDGDKESPHMPSYILFSQVIKNTTDITKCYSQGDPTSTEEADLLATDGGFIKIDGAYGIKRLVAVGSSLIVMAANGIWAVSGGSDYGFSATNYMVSKITERGLLGKDSVVVVQGSIIYWSSDGIYQVSYERAPGGGGSFVASNITDNTIRKYYGQIGSVEKESVKSFYDSYDGKVRWLYNTSPLQPAAEELILDVVLKAFYTSVIDKISGGLPTPVGYIEVQPYRLEEVQETVTYNGQLVTYNGQPVTHTYQRRQSATREALYLTITNMSPLRYTFSSYRDDTFTDWITFNGVGKDAKAELLTGWDGLGDFKRNKKITHLFMHMYKTETGFVGDFEPVNPSSCKVQVQWDWTDGVRANRWGTQFQAYRHRRVQFPTGIDDDFHSGENVVSTKSRLRGGGKVFAMKIESEPKKDLHIIGWSLVMDMPTQA